MTIPPESDLATFSEGTGFLLRRPLAVLGMALLGMALSALVPLFQVRLALPNDDLTTRALAFACLFPMEMYLVPRFLAEADASAGDRPQNPHGEWEKNFDQRWMKAMAGKFLLAAAIALGFVALVLPGLMVFFFFGWLPMRLLLRGEAMGEAARGSLRMMILSWRRVLVVVLALLLVNLAGLWLISLVSGLTEAPPAPWFQLTHPRVWIGNFAAVAQRIWTSACLLALFRRIDVLPQAASPGGGPIN